MLTSQRGPLRAVRWLLIGWLIVPACTDPTAPGVATQLTFGVQPNNATAGLAIWPVVTVAIEDAWGHTVTTATNVVTIAIASNPAGGTLTGTASAAAVNGIASFPDLRIDKAGTPYVLTAASGSLARATSSPFDVAGTVITGCEQAWDVSVVPSAALLGVGESVTLRARVHNFEGARIGCRVSWTSASPAIAAVSSDGVVTGVSPGTTAIVATAAGVMGEARVDVRNLAPSGLRNVPNNPVYDQ